MSLTRRFQQPIDRLDVARCDVLGDVALKNHIQGPTQSDTHFLFKPWQLHQVNASPQQPTHYSGKLKPEDSRDTCAGPGYVLTRLRTWLDKEPRTATVSDQQAEPVCQFDSFEWPVR